jgi:hypothetical protein
MPLPRYLIRSTARWITFALALALVACVGTDKTTFLNFGTPASSAPLSRDEVMAAPKVSDGLAINYANSIEIVMRCDATRSRITREVSATAQVGLAAFSGVGAAFHYSATTLAALGLGGVAIPELQKIFNAKARAEVYNQAANMIQDGVLEYYSHNTAPSSSEFTPNGLTLVKKVSAAITLVDTTLIGQLPSQKQMLQAVEAMTPEGTKKQDPTAAPVNASVPAALLRPPRAPETVTKNQIKTLQADMDRLAKSKPPIIDFVHDLRAYDRAATTEQKAQGYSALVEEAGLTGKVQPDKNAINDYYQNNASPQEMEELRKALEKQLKPLKMEPPLPRP